VREDLLREIQEAFASRRYLVTVHGARQADKRNITIHEVRAAIASEAAEVIEDYPSDLREPSCLIFGLTDRGKILHVQVAYPPRVAVITAYEPDPEKWTDGRRRRR
jgi:hypothetical protein